MSLRMRTLGPLERMLHMRSFSRMELPMGELRSLAWYAEERRVRANAFLHQGDQPVRSVWIVVEGVIERRRRGHPTHRVEAGGWIGVIDELARVESGTELVALKDSLVLQLPGPLMNDLLVNNIEQLLAGLRFMGQMVLALPELPLPPIPLQEGPPAPEAPLNLVDRLDFLTTTPPFGMSNLDSLLPLARKAEEVRFSAGEKIWSFGEHADYGLPIWRGLADLTHPQREPVIAGRGFGLGFIAALANAERAFDVVARTDLVGFKVPLTLLVSTLENDPELGPSLMRVMGTLLVDTLVDPEFRR